MSDSASSARRWFWAAVALTVLKLWLTAAQPLYAIGPSAYDDLLFLRLGEAISRGEWLGAYNPLTLAKGPFYPLWIAGMHLLGVPLFFSQHLLYAGACAALVRACRPALASAAARFGFYALLLWNPMTFDASSLGRVLRQHVYVPLGLLLLAGLVALYFRRRESFRRQWPWAVLLGLSFGAFYLTREETVWIGPSLALLAGAILFAAFRDSVRTALRSAVVLGLAALCALPPILGVATLNLRHYGWFGTVEFRDPAFNDAYGALLCVRVGPELPRIPVTREAREAMYAVSPTFALLRPQLEGELGRAWAGISADATGKPAGDLEIAGGWFMWALRDAVGLSGHANNAAAAHAFYRAMADELNAACDSGRLPAGPRRSGFLPPWRDGQKLAVAQPAASFADFVISFRRFSARPPASFGDDESLALFRRMTGGRLFDSEPPVPFLAGARVAVLHAVGKTLRHGLFWLFLVAQLIAGVRVVQSLARRTWSFPLTLAAAAWGGGLVYVVIQAVIDVTSFPVLAISSLASAYPMVPIFIAAVAWDAVLAWRPSAFGEAEAARTTAAPARTAEPEPIIADAPWRRRLPLLSGVLALAPFLLWHRQFAELIVFGDEFSLVEGIAKLGYGRWIFEHFTESYMIPFKAGWGATLFLSGGSYFAMLSVLWATHAVNVVLLGRLLLRAGFPWLAALLAQVLFALAPGNYETLGWTIQWSAVLATTFLLLGLLWLENRAAVTAAWSWRVHGALAVCALVSATCFARGVLTGGVFALMVALPVLLIRDWRGLLRRGPALLACLLPALAVMVAILNVPQGNQRQLGGHAFEIAQMGLTFLLLNPAHLLLGLQEITPASVVLLAGAKIAVVAYGLAVARGRLRVVLLALLAFDLGNAVLLGIGRYHTGPAAALGPRYLYGSLLATLPFAGLAVARLLERWVAAPRIQRFAGAALLASLVWYCLQGWPAVLEPFVRWRGTEQRALLAAPQNNDDNAMVPALDYMHIERAKALQRAYNLH